MSVLKSVVDVNNGNSGWTKQNLMDALETALGNLGLNAGSTVTGVPQICVAPDGSSTTLGGNLSYLRDANNADQGEISWGSIQTQGYKVTEVGTDYKVEKKLGINTYAPYYANMADLTTDELIYARHGLKTGDPVRYLPGETDAQYSLGTNLAPDTLVYIINVSRDRFKVATSASNATNGIAIDIDGHSTSSSQFPVVWQQEAQQASDYINPTIDIYYGDNIEFENVSGNATNITVCRDVDSFDNDQRIVYNDATYGSTPDNETSISYRTNTNNVSCVPGANLTWYTQSYPQSESEPFHPASLLNPSFVGRPGEDGIRKYIYCSETTATAKGVINLLPGNVNASLPSQVNSDPYYKYTVPASGGRSELKLRVWRGAYNDNHLKNITIHSLGSGWTDDEVFTIPGELVGGTATTGDIRFGVTTPETSNNAYDGIASIKTTTLGGGSNFYQKSGVGAFAVLNVENDATKKYGNTFYSLFLEGSTSTAWTLKIQCGNGWEFLNHRGTSSTSITVTNDWGAFTGYMGLDRQDINITNSVDFLTVSTSSTPTAYPMQIKTFRAQAPQDTNFAVIQFTQTINEKSEPFAAFNFHVGDGYGNNVFDLDEVFLGAYTSYLTNVTQGLRVMTYMPGYISGYSSYRGTSNEPVNSYSQARNAYYGYLRGDGSYNHYVYDDYYNNIKEGTNNPTAIYYRNSTYDKYDNVSMDASADYYKPIKTIPISQRMIPCPYYLPDDFVLLQVATTPGLTEFRPGDTVTVSGSEIYEVIQASYAAQQTGLDGVSNNSSEGMLFLARTT
jgi:hypothetical protein